MEISQLRYFCCAAQTEHITKAAERLHLAQPALTKSIRLLEEELGVKLFERRGRNVYLTEYGKYLAKRAEEITAEFEALPSEVTALARAVKNTVTVNVLAASTFVTDIVIAFKKKNPSALFRLIQSEKDERCDVTVTTAKLNEHVSEFDRQKIFEERIFIAVPKTSGYALMGEAELTDLAGEGFVGLAGSRHFRVVCDRLCARAGFVPRMVFESDNPVAVRNLIGAGVGIGFWPEYSWGKLPRGEVSLIPIKNADCKRELIVGYNGNGVHSGMAEKFFDFASEKIEKRISGNH
ncbi:MAG: LysR family transcriptional regulator [Clostridia bacterium]|nr:LysR family transcriptional regulator [Clostridia bacterium]